jgi:type VI secretion system protein ImpK
MLLNNFRTRIFCFPSFPAPARKTAQGAGPPDCPEIQLQQNTSRTYSLASCYENAFTVILRLAFVQSQSNVNSQEFRVSVRAALKAAMEQAKTLGYSSEINQLGFFAVVGLLDETVLKAQNPAFADWAQRPLQEEMFGHNRAGEVFFDHLQNLLVRADSPETADCLEMYCLCMLLGFKGRYALSASITSFSGLGDGGGQSSSRPSGEIYALIQQTREKIERIRGRAAFMPDSAAPPVKPTLRTDHWSRGLGIAAASLALVAMLSYMTFWMILSSGMSRIL